jgi:hypothetical protein
MGWGDAWAGLSQQAFAATINSLEDREQRKYQDKRDEMARKAEEKQRAQREQYEMRMLEKRASLDAQASREQRKFQKGLSDTEFQRQMERDAAIAAREAADPYRQSLVAESQARVKQMNQPAMSGGGGSGLAQPRRTSDTQINAVRSEFKGQPVEEAYQAAAAKYGPELAQAAFPGAANAAQNLARGLGILDSASERARSYIQ